MESGEHNWKSIPEIKRLSEKEAGTKRIIIAVAGGIRVDTVTSALGAGADILVVGRAITRSKDVRDAAEQFISKLQQSEIDQYRIMTDF